MRIAAEGESIIGHSIRALGAGVVAGLILLACDARDDSTVPPPPAIPPPPAVTAAAVETAPRGRPLAPGQTHQGTLSGGAAGVHLLALEADVFVRVLVEQSGIDVVARLIDPAGNPLIEFDKKASRRPEQVLWVTAVPGIYTLEIMAFGQPAAGDRYRVRFEAARPATEQDRKRHAAELLFAEGERLRHRPDADSWRRAEGELRRAVALWQELGDRTRHADGLYLLARTYAHRDPQLAIETFEATIALLDDEADHYQKAAALQRLGSLHYQAGELQRAVERYRQAIPLRAGNLRGEATTYNDLGLTHKMLGETSEALTNYRLALERFRQLDDPLNEAVALHNLGKGLLATGLLPEALDRLEQALEIRQRLELASRQAATLIAIGQVRVKHRQLDRALDAQRRALALARQAGDPNLEAVALSDVALTYIELKRFEEALDLYRQALQSFQASGNRHDEAMTLHNLGRALDALGQDAGAADHYRRALALFEAVGHRHGRIMTLHGKALVERQLGHWGLARSHHETALAEIERLRTLAQSHTLRYSYFATQQDYYEAYVDFLMALHRATPGAGHDAEALAASERARARSQLDALTESDADLRRGAPPELRERETALEEEIESLEIQRQRLLDEGVGRSRLSAIERRLRSLFLEHDRVQGDIRRASPRYAALTQPQPLDAAQIRRVVDRDTLLLEYDLGSERSYLWAVTPDRVHSFELKPRQVIETAARRAYRLLSSSHLTASKVPTELALDKLSRLLLRPVADLLVDKRLLIVGDGALQYIPFAALPEPVAGDPVPAAGAAGAHTPRLGERHEIVSMPSASTLAVLRRQIGARRPPRGTVAVLADPVFELSDPRFQQQESEPASSTVRGPATPGGRRYDRLVYSRREADDILALAPAGETFAAIGFEASRDVVMSGRLADYRFLHFATHGVLNTERSELSWLVMSRFDRAGRERDGFVFGHEIYNLELAADLVVLSACETALGAEIRGEGLLGFAQGFMYAGAASVLVSLWNVDDQATAELMARFYHRLLIEGLRPAAALRAAQAEIRQQKRWLAPYFWAGFVLQGEWR